LEPFWAAAEALQMPVSLHILTGFDWSRRVSSDLFAGRPSSPQERAANGEFGLRGVVNFKLCSAMNSLHDVIVSGVLERHPGLRLVLVETEIGWLPFALHQWDKYCSRPSSMGQAITRLPSEYFADQVYATFFNDPPGASQLAWWGERNCMWSNDFPHPNSTWPHSLEVIERDLGPLSAEARELLQWRTCAELYALDVAAVGAKS
jgi:predicted TIM-barrel fold metal-dependent hydrolase